MIAAKLFSAFSDTPRKQDKQDKQDVVAALDQKQVSIVKVCEIADQIFNTYSMDARSDRFPKVREYITNELMADYGHADLKYRAD